MFIEFSVSPKRKMSFYQVFLFVMYLHSNRFFEFAETLDLIHEITTVDKLHHKIKTILKN